jgi:hypothetical protein
MQILPREFLVKGGAVGHALRRYAHRDARNDQINVLECAVGLFCQHQAEDFQMVFFIE